MDIVYAFTDEEAKLAQILLEQLVRVLRNVPGGGKVEENYWTHIYNTVKKAPITGWSNLPMRDFSFSGVGVEMKLLQRISPFSDQGKSIMHPAATRTISFDPTQNAEVCKEQVLSQFGSQIAAFRERVKATSENKDPIVRWGVFLWATNLEEFLYFEETMVEPNPKEYRAEFSESSHRGNATRNLYIYEKSTNKKRYSVTMPEKGAKVQPYFDVPTIGKGSYGFKVPNDNKKPLWVSPEVIEKLVHVIGEDNIDKFLLDEIKKRQ